jgi:hypothetical protein
VNTDCVGKLCDRDTCVPVHCTDDIANEDETDVDCGGPCATCDTGQSCKLGSDCTSRLCESSTCAAPACDDAVQNGEETDLDCGGAECEACADTLACLAGSDCSSGVCQGGRCQPASCSDSVKNGDEAAADCGSVCPSRCLDGEACVEPSDCNSGVCDQTCQPPRCDDSVMNGTETDVDCGGGCPDSCRSGDGCRVHGDCITGACVQRECAATLQVFYRNDTADQSQFIRPLLQLRNSGPTGIALAELELRYFYTNDGAENEIADCYFAQPGCDKLMIASVPLEPPRAGHYLSVKFGANAGSVPVAGTHGFELALHQSNFTNYDQTSDYSYDPSKSAYSAHDKVCLYRNGTLIWGTEPPP